MLDKAVAGSLTPLLSPAKSAKDLRSNFPAFRQNITSRQDDSKFLVSPTINRAAINGPIAPVQDSSLDSRMLQLQEKTKDVPNSEISTEQKPRTDSSAALNTADHKEESANREATATESTTSQPGSQNPSFLANSLRLTDGPVGSRPPVQSSSVDANLREEQAVNVTEHNRVIAPTSGLKNGPLVIPISFLQTSSSESIAPAGALDAVSNVLNKLSNVAAPVVNIEVVVRLISVVVNHG